MIIRVALILFIATLTLGASAQEPPAAGAPEAATPAPADPAPAPQAEEAPEGDIVTLNNGHEYRGLQVLKSTAAEVILEVTEEVTLKIPRRQIKNIQYDDIDPVEERAKAKLARDTAAAAGITLLQGQKVSPELQKLLETDISNPPIPAEERDLVDVIADVNKRVNDAIVVDKPVLDLPANQRKWTLTARPGMTLAMLLQEEFSKAFPDLAMLIRDDKLLLTSKEAALKILEAEGTAAPPAAPAQPATETAAPTT